ncbi:hypothetical protein, partial [Hydrotalea sp.]|uniref:hypothetical protein n=1 Tax=Hydrotalea sp. TaxID=2881279 RepID=UPI0025890362
SFGDIMLQKSKMGVVDNFNERNRLGIISYHSQEPGNGMRFLFSGSGWLFPPQEKAIRAIKIAGNIVFI